MVYWYEYVLLGEERERVLLLLDRHRAVVRDEVVVRERRAGGDHLRAGHHDALVGFLDRVDEDVVDLVDVLVAVDRRVHQRVVHEEDLLLGLLVPTPRVVGVRRVVVGVRPVRREECGLVIRAPAHPAVRHALPGGDRVAPLDQILGRPRRLEIGVRVTTVAGVGWRGQHVLRRRIVEPVVQAGHAANAVPERRMRRHILDLLTVDPDLATVPEAVEVLLAVHRAGRWIGRSTVVCGSCHA